MSFSSRKARDRGTRAEHAVMWKPCSEPGLEHLQLRVYPDEIVADGIVIGVDLDQPFRMQYTVRCDSSFTVRSVEIACMPSMLRRLELHHDGEGGWTDSSGSPLLGLRNCQYVDISVSPFTNTLPIRRLGMKPGDSAEISVVYITSALELSVERQRYTCLEAGGGVTRFQYESLVSGFSADVTVDREGLVLRYDDIFERVWPV
jgi:uncharacterized protein